MTKAEDIDLLKNYTNDQIEQGFFRANVMPIVRIRLLFSSNLYAHNSFLLLSLIKRTALEIDATAADIWTQGKLVANNTIHIPMFLSTTNAVVHEILDNAVEVLDGTVKVEQHIDGCPGCPECVLGR